MSHILCSQFAHILMAARFVSRFISAAWFGLINVYLHIPLALSPLFFGIYLIGIFVTHTDADRRTPNTNCYGRIFINIYINPFLLSFRLFGCPQFFRVACLFHHSCVCFYVFFFFGIYLLFCFNFCVQFASFCFCLQAFCRLIDCSWSRVSGCPNCLHTHYQQRTGKGVWSIYSI